MYISEFDGIVSRLLNMTKASLGGMALESSSYVQQFKDAMNVNGGDLESATLLDYILHFLTFGWKVWILSLADSDFKFLTFSLRCCTP